METPMLFLNLGGSEIILIMLVVLLLFGSKKIPELARGLGKGIREFKDATQGIQREIEKGMNETKEVIEKDTVQRPQTPTPYTPPQSIARRDDDEPADEPKVESPENETTETEKDEKKAE